jgi:beta-galactosidase/beta-glucuronidase
VNRTLLPDEYLWYRRTVTLPDGFRRDRLLLHFGAVDQIATVYVDGTELVPHIGGYTPVTVDLTAAVQTGRFELTCACATRRTARG